MTAALSPSISERITATERERPNAGERRRRGNRKRGKERREEEQRRRRGGKMHTNDEKKKDAVRDVREDVGR